jgi:hypothetical protein
MHEFKPSELSKPSKPESYLLVTAYHPPDRNAFCFVRVAFVIRLRRMTKRGVVSCYIYFTMLISK